MVAAAAAASESEYLNNWTLTIDFRPVGSIQDEEVSNPLEIPTCRFRTNLLHLYGPLLFHLHPSGETRNFNEPENLSEFNLQAVENTSPSTP